MVVPTLPCGRAGMALSVKTVDLHTNGQPFRVVVSVSPKIAFPDGANLVEKRRFLMTKYDIVRKLMMREPRGHSDMYGGILTEPDAMEKRGDVAVLFIEHGAYSTMCGHGTMATARYAVEFGLVPRTEPETRVVVQVPCGIVEAFAEVTDGKATGQIRILAPRGYLHARDLEVDFRGRRVTFDIGYGGAFYAIVTASDLELNLEEDAAREIVQAASEFKAAVMKAHKIHVADANAPPDYLFLYGVLLADARIPTTIDSTLNHTIVFGDGQVDRSPCGSGSTARLSCLATRGLLEVNKTVGFCNPKVGQGSFFRGTVLSTGHKSVPMGLGFIEVANGIQCEIRGQAFLTAESTFCLEENDIFPEGLEVC